MSAAQQQTTLDELRERVPDRYLKHRTQGGSNITYISWYDVCELLDDRAPGWSLEVKEVGERAGMIYVRVALTIDGVTRENIGCEDEDMKGYGDVFSNIVGMASRRAAALFGLGRHLYDKGDASRQPQRPQQQRLPQPQSAKPAPAANPTTQAAPRATDEQKTSIYNLWLQLHKAGELVDQAAWQKDLVDNTGANSRDELTHAQAQAYVVSLQKLLRDANQRADKRAAAEA
jgi:hypothetical protein